jgi:hypothetical protein
VRGGGEREVIYTAIMARAGSHDGGDDDHDSGVWVGKAGTAPHVCAAEGVGSGNKSG